MKDITRLYWKLIMVVFAAIIGATLLLGSLGAMIAAVLLPMVPVASLAYITIFIRSFLLRDAQGTSVKKIVVPMNIQSVFTLIFSLGMLGIVVLVFYSFLLFVVASAQ